MSDSDVQENGLTNELSHAIASYWNTKTPDEERAAYARMLAAKVPPSYGEVTLQPFAAVFPAANIRHHFIGQGQEKGVYAKELHIPAGFLLVSHSHGYDHLSVLASGTVQITIGGKTETMTGPRAITIRAGEPHTLRAVTKAVWFCIHPTDETDVAKVDDAILTKAD